MRFGGRQVKYFDERSVLIIDSGVEVFLFSPDAMNINSFDFVDLVKNSSSLPILAN